MHCFYPFDAFCAYTEGDRMDFKRLRYALAVADEGNFVRAAERVNISQPALSRAVQTLEEELGIALFDRGNRHVTVTHAGATFFEHARRLLTEVRNMEHDMTLLRSGDSGRLAFGTGPLHTSSLLQPLLQQLRLQHPGLQLTVAVNNTPYLLEHLRAEELEFFVADVRSIAPADDLEITSECRQQGGFFCRSGHPLLAGGPVQWTDLLTYGLACPTLPPPLEAQLRKLLRLGPGKRLPLAVECDNLTVLKESVMDSHVILMSSVAAAASELREGRMAALPIDLPPSLYVDVGSVRLRGRTLSPAALLAQQAMRAIFASQPATTVTYPGAAS
jgi:DNA-binding transcriptional LysR family regulator